jgi:hypothetical protein
MQRSTIAHTKVPMRRGLGFKGICFIVELLAVEIDKAERDATLIPWN